MGLTFDRMTATQTAPPGVSIVPEWTFGDRLRKAREQLSGPDGKRLTIEQMAALIGISKSALGSWELDSHRPNVATVRRIAEITGVDPGWLIGGAYDERGRRISQGYSQPELWTHFLEAS